MTADAKHGLHSVIAQKIVLVKKYLSVTGSKGSLLITAEPYIESNESSPQSYTVFVLRFLLLHLGLINGIEIL